MDSAVECLVYALNALGFGFKPAAFISVESENFYRRLGLEQTPPPIHAQVFTHPDETIRVRYEPAVGGKEASWKGQPIETLEQLTFWFVEFMNETGVRALDDVRQRMPMSDPALCDSARPLGRPMDC